MQQLITITAALCTLAVSPGWAAAPPNGGRALQDAESALKRDPMDTVAFEKLLHSSAEVGGLGALIERINGRADAEPDSIEWRIVLGHLRRHQADCNDALPEYKHAVQSKPRSPWGHMALADCQHRLGAWQSAIEHWRKAIQASSNKALIATIRWKMVTAAVEQHAIDTAQKVYKQLTRADPSNVRNSLRYATLLKQHRHFQAAADTLHLWLKKSRNDPKNHVAVLLEWAHLVAKNGQFDAAEARIRQTLRSLPKEHWARIELYEGLVTLFRNEGRLEQLIPVVRRWPTSIPNQLLLAQIYEELGNSPDALALYRRIVKKRPGNRTATAAVERLLRDGGNRAALLHHVEKMARIARSDPQHALVLAKLYFEDGSNEKAMGIIGKLIRRFSSDPSVQESILETLQRSNVGSSHIVRAYKRLIRLEPQDLTHRVALGEYFHSEGQTREALSTWDKMVTNARNKKRAYVIRARTLAEHRMIERAVEDYQRALKLNPTDYSLYREMATILEQAERLSEALRHWEVLSANTSKPGGAAWEEEALAHVVDLHSRLGTLEPFVRTQQTLLKETPKNRHHALLLAQAHLTLNHWTRAQKVLETSRKHFPKDALLLSLLVRALEGQNKAPQCLSVLRRLAELDPQRARDGIERFSQWGNHGDEAIQLAQLLVDLNPTDTAAFAHLGQLHVSRNSLRAALAAYRRAVELEPSNTSHRLALADILRKLQRRSEYIATLGALLRTTNDADTIAQAGKQILQLADPREVLVVVDVLLDVVNRRHKAVQHRNVLLALLEQIMRVRQPTVGNRSGVVVSVPKSVINRTVKPILDGLNDPDLTVRSRCLDLLHSIPITQAMPRLLPMLETPDSVLRSKAIAALAHIGNDDASPALTSLLKRHDQRLRVEVIWALGAIHGDKALNTLTHLPKHRNMSNELNTIWAAALGQHASPKAIPHLRRLAQNPAETVRRTALWALGQIDSRQSVSILIARLPAESPANQQAILDSLGPTGIREARAKLLPLCVGDDPVLGLNAWRTLQRGVRIKPASTDRLRKQYLSIRTERRASIQSQGIPNRFLWRSESNDDGTALVQQMGPSLLSEILRLLNDPDSERRHRTAQALLPLGANRKGLVTGPNGAVQIPVAWHKSLTNAFLQRLAKERDTPTRVVLLDALARIHDGQDLTVFGKALGEQSPTVVRTALRALGRSTNHHAIEVLERNAQTSLQLDWLTRVAWVLALGEAAQRHPSNQNGWAQYRDIWLRDPHLEVRVAVWKALQTMERRHAPATHQAKEHLSHGDPRLALAVVEAAIGWPDADRTSVLTEALTHPQPTIRERARYALANGAATAAPAPQQP